MEALKRARRLVRREFDILYRELEVLLKEDKLQDDVINVKFKLFNDTCDKLETHNGQIIEQLTVDKVEEANEDKEWDEIREFKLRAESIRQLKERKLPPNPLPGTGSISGCNTAEVKIRNFKLPTVQMKRFSGALEDWLGFWAQFQKIDEDISMHGGDKFWYLLQSLEPGTDAHELATGYPLSNENYPIVIEALKKQYGDEDLQLQVYLRKLLKLVICNVDSKEKMPVKNLYLKLDSHLRALKTLRLEEADPATWLFPLVESCLPDTILDNWQRSPLSSQDCSNEDPPRTRLDLLMEFVGNEVKIQQRIAITKSFTNDKSSESRGTKIKSTDVKHRKPERGPIPTLASFHSGEVNLCVFCDRNNHSSGDCFRAKSMSYDQKIEILKRKGLCFRCTGKHIGPQCKGEGVECNICKRKHLTVLCRDLKLKRDRREFGNYNLPQQKKRRVEMEVPTTASNASMECSSDVALKTLLLRIKNGKKQKIVRAFIDEGSQRSYILTSTAREMNLEPEGVQRVVHSLFGGQRTSVVSHNVYEVEILSIDGDFQLKFPLRDQGQICGVLPSVNEKFPEIVGELKKKGVVLTDTVRGNGKIEMLIGADLFPKLITGKFEGLQCGAVAIYTRLGWTLMGELRTSAFEDSIALASLTMSVADGKMKECDLGTSVLGNSIALAPLTMSVADGKMKECDLGTSVLRDSIALAPPKMSVTDGKIKTREKRTSVPEDSIAMAWLTMSVTDGEITWTSAPVDSIAMAWLTMSVADGVIRNMWELEAMGVCDPSEENLRKKKEEMALEKYKGHIKMCEGGRYSVKLPWKENGVLLPINREVAFKRLQSVSKKLVEKGLYTTYNKIFQEWQQEGFIERVLMNEGAERVHYLPHRPVIKESLTTPVRPVFDASCRVGKTPSLNDCLFTGENCVKIIPDIIQRFREKRIAFVADIRKAFQMIWVDQEDRDYMRFLWWQNEEMTEVVEFRHARVLFGATCSPFILAAVIHFHLENLPEDEQEMGKKLLSTLYVDNAVNSEDSTEAYQEYREKSTDIMKRAGMELRMWMSNVEDLDNETTRVISVLGIMWDRKTDKLFVNIKGISMPEKVTKRTVLSVV